MTRLHALLLADLTCPDDTLVYPKFATVVYDSASAYSTTTGIFTAPTDGFYLCEFAAKFTTALTNQPLIGFYDSGVVPYCSSWTNGIQPRLTTVIHLARLATIRPYLATENGTTQTLVADTGSTWLKIHRLF